MQRGGLWLATGRGEAVWGWALGDDGAGGVACSYVGRGGWGRLRRRCPLLPHSQPRFRFKHRHTIPMAPVALLVL